MAQILLKNTGEPGKVPTHLAQGEVAINTTDGKLFYSDGAADNIKEFGVSSSFASTALTSSYALTASYALNGGGGGSVDTSSLVTTSSFNSFTSSYNTGSFTGSFIGTHTGSLFGTSSWAISASWAPVQVSASYALTSSYSNNSTSASYALTASYLSGYVSPFPYTGSAIISGSLTVVGTIDGLGNTLPKYEIFSWRSRGGVLDLTHPSDFNPQNAGQSSLANTYIQYLYIDILDFTNGTTYQNLRFNVFTDLTDYIATLSTTDYNVIFYSYRNHSDNLRVGGTNNFIAAIHTKDPRSKRHITSKKRIVADTARPAFVALQTFLSGPFLANVTGSIPNFTTNYINQDQLDRIQGDYDSNNNSTFRISPINKFKKRDFSRYYIGNWNNTTNTLGQKVTTSNPYQAKILGTMLCKYNYLGSPTVQFVNFITNYGYESIIKQKEVADGDNSYFHIYVIQTADNGRVLAVEGITIDNINIPSAYNKVTATGNPIGTLLTLYRQGNRLYVRTPNIGQDTYGVPQTSCKVPVMNNSLTTVNVIDVISLYTDGTCDVFPNALQLEKTKYTTSRLILYKLNADYQRV